eukprot:7409053-Pyramimonas_sp.AAC.1
MATLVGAKGAAFHTSAFYTSRHIRMCRVQEEGTDVWFTDKIGVRRLRTRQLCDGIATMTRGKLKYVRGGFCSEEEL